MSEGIDLNLVSELGNVKRIPGIALQVMVVGILIPPSLYAFNLKNPTPAQLLIAVCMSLFSAVVFLWILDSTSILRFRSEWVSRSVYGAAIASVLGTSVAVYHDAFTELKYPLQGAWDLTIINSSNSQVVADSSVALAYSESSASYWGYSNVEMTPARAAGQALWLHVIHFRPSTRQISIRLVFPDGSSRIIDEILVSDGQQRVFGSTAGPLKISLSRPNV